MLRHLNSFKGYILHITCAIVVTALIFAIPQLSDDYFRFLWDAELISKGISPYAYLPSELVKEGTINFNKELYDSLNSKEYYSIYPPFNQAIYFIASKFCNGFYSFSIDLKLIYLIISIIGFRTFILLLRSLNIPENNVFIFYLNPLVLIEGVGNLHIELVTCSFLIIAFYIYHINNSKTRLFSLAYSAAIASKLNPLLISPFFWFNQHAVWRNRVFLFTVIFSVLLLCPILYGLDVSGFLSSIDLYFRKFEFNGSIYYLLRYVGMQFSGYNLIAYLGPGLGLIIFLAIISKSITTKERDVISIIRLSAYSWTVYLLLSTTVHPWYIIPLILFSVMIKMRFVLVWSFLITLTYINYSYPSYFENLYVVGVEYGIVISLLIYEIRTNSLILLSN